MSGTKRLLAALIALAPGAALAQAERCDLPRTLPRIEPDLPDARQPRRLLPIGSYTLAFSWSPEQCRGRERDPRERIQCGGGNRFGWVLHGLWPDGRGSEWPQYCRATRLLTPAELRANLCMTPSPQLLQHEWAKHGTCMTRQPARYFAQARRHYQRLRFPDMAALGRRETRAGDLVAAFVDANPGWRADMVRVRTNRQGWLDELWLCMDVRQRPVRCPAHQTGAANGSLLKIRPVG